MGTYLKKKKSLIGKKFGKLVVLEKVRSDNKGRGFVWKCKCDCGNYTEALSAKLNGKRKKSCGCLLSGNCHYMWSGYKELSGYSWSRIVGQAQTRNINMEISIQDAWEQYEIQNKKCALTGQPIVFSKNTKELAHEKAQTASFDRIDSMQGYIKNNIQWIHKDINLMKSDMNENSFIYWCKKIAEYNLHDVNLPKISRKRWEFKS